MTAVDYKILKYKCQLMNQTIKRLKSNTCFCIQQYLNINRFIFQKILVEQMFLNTTLLATFLSHEMFSVAKITFGFWFRCGHQNLKS